MLRLLQTVRVGEGSLWHAAWNPQGTILAVCGQDREIVLFNLNDNSLRETERLSGVHKKTIRSVAFDASGLRLASASFDGRVAIYLHRRLTGGEAGLAPMAGESENWRQAACLEGHENEVKGVAWSPSASLLATCGRDRTVWIWSTEPHSDEFECVAVLAEHTQDVKQVKWLPLITASGEILVSCSYDDSVRMWQCDPVYDEWFPSGHLTGHISTVWSCDFEPNTGRRMVTVSDDRCLVLWQRIEQGGTILFEPHLRTWHAHRAPIYSVSWGTAFIATCSADRSIALWHAEELKEASRVEDAHQAEINCVAWHPALSLLVSVSDDGILNLWALEDE